MRKPYPVVILSANNLGAGSPPMSLTEIIKEHWAILIAFVSGLVWLVRLEGRVNHGETNQASLKERVDILQTKHDSLDSKLVAQLSDVRESLARIEGRLGVNKGE
ncbi:MAG: hypothetical protein BWZ03_00146 [bacterium ADurb.BinA186]|nr:MAG: hypothetical protein BWZ03_00146 [bacterium ADurb.BinA186]